MLRIASDIATGGLVLLISILTVSTCWMSVLSLLKYVDDSFLQFSSYRSAENPCMEYFIATTDRSGRYQHGVVCLSASQSREIGALLFPSSGAHVYFMLPVVSNLYRQRVSLFELSLTCSKQTSELAIYRSTKVLMLKLLEKDTTGIPLDSSAWYRIVRVTTGRDNPTITLELYCSL
jgi:hypothetical protein